MMQRTNGADEAVKVLLLQQGGVIRRSQALAAGMTKDAVKNKIKPEGRWKVVLPGIYLGHDGIPTSVEREIAAALYVGRGCVITGQAALQRLGIRAPIAEVIDVLIPRTAKRQSVSFVRVHRTARMPNEPWRIDGVLWAPPARAISDAARFVTDAREVRALVADGLQRGRCTVAALAAELEDGPTQGTAALRAALEDVAAGVRSAAEGDLRRLVKKFGLPEPLFNPRLYLGDEFLAEPDAWWTDADVAGEVESREWHISPAAWDRTMARRTRMEAKGISVLQFTPRRLRTSPAEVASLLRSAIEVGRSRPRLPIRAVPCDARPAGKPRAGSR